MPGEPASALDRPGGLEHGLGAEESLEITEPPKRPVDTGRTDLQDVCAIHKRAFIQRSGDPFVRGDDDIEIDTTLSVQVDPDYWLPLGPTDISRDDL